MNPRSVRALFNNNLVMCGFIQSTFSAESTIIIYTFVCTYHHWYVLRKIICEWSKKSMKIDGRRGLNPMNLKIQDMCTGGGVVVYLYACV